MLCIRLDVKFQEVCDRAWSACLSTAVASSRTMCCPGLHNWSHLPANRTFKCDEPDEVPPGLYSRQHITKGANRLTPVVDGRTIVDALVSTC